MVKRMKKLNQEGWGLSTFLSFIAIIFIAILLVAHLSNKYGMGPTGTDNSSKGNEFLEKYAMPKNIYMYNGISIPFKLFEIHGNRYLFVTNYNKQENEVLEQKIKQIKYNMNNLVMLNNDEINNMQDYTTENFIIINNHYYK